jgi:hypothetical protein
MERKVIWTILIGIILFGVVFFFGIYRLPQPSQSAMLQPSLVIPPVLTTQTTQVPTPMGPHPDPIFHKGDVVMSSNEDLGGGILIKNYDPASDTYLLTWVQKSNDQTWYHGTDPYIFGPDEKWSRTKVESEYPYKIGSANPDSLSTTPSNAPIHLKGGNSDLKKFDTYQSGAYIFTSTYSGNGNFIVWIKDSQGNLIGLAANVIGSYDGSSMLKLYADTYYAEVTANGPWSIDISLT